MGSTGEFWQLWEGTPGKLDFLASRAGLTGDRLEYWLRDEIQRRQSLRPDQNLTSAVGAAPTLPPS
jgi:hypothetical protein